MRAAIVGIAGPTLADAEADAFRAHPPAGVILFRRNVQHPAQLRALAAALRQALPAEAVLMVDQEGGRVARLRPPGWRAHPPAGTLGALHQAEPTAGLRAAWLTGALIGLDCHGAGLDVATAPVLDLRVPGAHDVVGDRAYAAEPDAVAALAGAVADGLLAAGVQPVGKHAPGHGRANCDSHQALPRVDHQPDADLLPFQRLAPALPWMMTAHVLFPQWDPAHPATLSAAVIGGVIRGRIGFGGLLVSDDLAMGALHGAPAALACEALAAGCDVALFCAGDAADTRAVLQACSDLTPAAVTRLADAASLAAARRRDLDAAALAAERDRLLGQMAA